MKNRNHLHQATIFLGAAALASFISLPALSQTNPGSRGVNTPQPDQNSQIVPNRKPGNVTQPSPGSATPTPNRANPAGNAQNTPTQSQTSASFSNLDREFILMAAQGNNAEIQTSQLALQKSTDSQVRDFAQRMIQEHTVANQRLATLASRYGVNLTADVGPLNAAIAQQLTPLSGAEFDRAYMAAQENAHLRTIALFRTAIQQGQADDVQGYASALLPNIDSHYEMANQMVNQMQASASGTPSR